MYDDNLVAVVLWRVLRLCDFVLLNKSGRKEESTIQLKRAQAKQATCSLFCCGLVLSFFPDGTRQFSEKFLQLHSETVFPSNLAFY